MSPARTSEQLTDLVRDLVKLPDETPWLEYKENNQNPPLIGEYISALSNAAALEEKERGYMIWGVEDGTRRIVGSSFKPRKAKKGNEDLIHWLVRSLDPQVHFEFHELEIDGKPVVILEIDRAQSRPVGFCGLEYIRVGSYKKKLRDYPEYERRLWRAFDAGNFESGVAASRLSAEDALGMLDYPAYFQMMGIPLPDGRSGILEALVNEDMLRAGDGGNWAITNLGAMLFARDLEDFPGLKRKALRIVQYKGIDRTATIREHIENRGYANSFQVQISFINTLLPSNEHIGQALRQTVQMYPELAIRELVANALIHQDFSLTGTGPMVEIFDDRVEITNPGTPLVHPLRFVDSPPRSRNERLAAVMRRGGVCEERGTGWDKVGAAIELHQLPAPLVEVTGEHTRVTLFSYRELKDMDRRDKARAVYLHTVLRYVTRQRVTNASVRERFGIDVRNSATASKLIKDAMQDRLIVLRDPDAPTKLREYVPWWAAPDHGAEPRFP